MTYSFDENSNVTRGARETNSSATHSITYDALNRATVLDKPYGVRVTNVFDEVSNRTEFRDSFGGIQTNVYDPVDRLTITKFTGQGLEVRYDQGYYETHELKSIHRYTKLDGTELRGRTSYILDTRNRLTNIEHRDGAGERFAYYTFAYDEANRLTSEERNTVTRNFGYDRASQLTADGPLPHSYDGTGNRTDTAQHQTVAGNRLTNDGLWTYTYDSEGNLEKKSKGDALETWKYFYDHTNQLTRVDKRASDGGTLQQRVDFKYDAFGQRIEKVVDSNGDLTPDTTLRFAYDGENVFADFGTDSSLTTRYLRGDVIDQIFARVGAPGMAGELNWLLTDRLGSVHNVLGASGTILATLVYDGFGNITTESDASKTGRYTWTGRERDVEIDLQYNRARYYDPATGRWIHRDPLGFDAGDSNLYRYVNNGPTNATDPSGLDPADDAFDAYVATCVSKRRQPTVTREQYRKEWLEIYGPRPATFDKYGKGTLPSAPPAAPGTSSPQPSSPAAPKDPTLERYHRQKELFTEMVLPRKTADLEPATRAVVLAREFAFEHRDELAMFGKLLNYGNIALQLYVGLCNWWHPGGWYLIYRGVEGIASEITREERWSTQWGRYLEGQTGANKMEFGLMVLDLAVAWRLSRIPEVQGGPVRVPTNPTNPYNIRTTGMSAAERAATIEYAQRTNAWLAQNGPVTVQGTAGPLRSQANAATRAERLRAARAGEPYQGQAGHVPDTALTGQPNPPAGWLDMPGTSNQSAGGGLGSRIGRRVDVITVDGQVPPPLP